MLYLEGKEIILYATLEIFGELFLSVKGISVKIISEMFLQLKTAWTVCLTCLVVCLQCTISIQMFTWCSREHLRWSNLLVKYFYLIRVQINNYFFSRKLGSKDKNIVIKNKTKINHRLHTFSTTSIPFIHIHWRFHINFNKILTYIEDFI